jgi:hypothetical protein
MSSVLRLFSLRVMLVLAGVVTLAAALAAQQPGMKGMGPGPGMGMKGDPTHMKDMQQFHELLEKRALISRTVKVLPDGVDTLTESDDPAVATLIRSHVVAMYARVSEARPIHMRDPLFREVFANASKIVMKHENTPKGVRVMETSADPYVAKLIQAHAEVVNLFLKNGMEEMHKDHEVPARTP